MNPPQRPRLFGKLRLRHKLAILLSIAALLPVVVVSWVGASVVMRSLSMGVIDTAERQLEVGLNLLLRQVERYELVAAQVASTPGLADAIEGGTESIDRTLAAQSYVLPASLVQVADAGGELLGHRIVGAAKARFSGLGVGSGDPVLEAGLGYERRLTLAPVGDDLVVRAVAPVVDDTYALRGAVVVSVPLDSYFADGLKAALGTEVLIFAGREVGRAKPAPAMATFVDEEGGRIKGIEIPPAVAQVLAAGKTSFSSREVAGREYTLAYAPLYDIGGAVVGVFAAAVDRAPLAIARRASTRSLALGAAGAFVFALGLAGLLSRRITRPIVRLHQGAIAIARGDLRHEIEVAEGDEIGDLATAFSNMTEALEENQRRLAARMREIVALHDAGRAVSSVIDLDQVLRKIVDQVARVLAARVCAIWLVEGGGLRLGAVRAKKRDMRTTLKGPEEQAIVEPLVKLASEVATSGTSIRRAHHRRGASVDEVSDLLGTAGSVMAVPLERKGAIVGVIVVARMTDAKSFTEAHQSLLATFADQAAAAIDNARLYQEVRAFNEELEGKVAQRTRELMEANADLEHAIAELQETQAQLVLSERLAGLGQLVAGVAHEINSPSAAIAGTIDAYATSIARLTQLAPKLASMGFETAEWNEFHQLADEAAGELVNRMVPSPALVRRTAKALEDELRGRGLAEDRAARVARQFADLVPEPELLARLVDFALVSGDDPERTDALIAYLREYVYLHRGARTIAAAIKRIQRIVGGLKGYSHLDQERRSDADLHAGIEDTLVILEHQLGSGIRLERRYGDLPPVRVFVDELNQVWTNLIHNAVQALEGSGNIAIETAVEGREVAVRIIDDGAGIPPENLEKIFEPFYTTKAKGEGTGLGLRIVKQIIGKHSGTVRASSRPGRTCFEVRLPIEDDQPDSGAAS